MDKEYGTGSAWRYSGEVPCADGLAVLEDRAIVRFGDDADPVRSGCICRTGQCPIADGS